MRGVFRQRPAAHELRPRSEVGYGAQATVLGIARKLSRENRTEELDGIRDRLIEARVACGHDVTFERMVEAEHFPRPALAATGEVAR